MLKGCGTSRAEIAPTCSRLQRHSTRQGACCTEFNQTERGSGYLRTSSVEMLVGWCSTANASYQSQLLYQNSVSFRMLKHRLQGPKFSGMLVGWRSAATCRVGFLLKQRLRGPCHDRSGDTASSCRTCRRLWGFTCRQTSSILWRRTHHQLQAETSPKGDSEKSISGRKVSNKHLGHAPCHAAFSGMMK